MQPATTEPRFELSDVTNKRKRAQLAELLAERAKYARQKKEAEDMGKACNEAIVPILDDLGIKTIIAPDDQGETKRFTVVHGTSSHINRMRLIELCVDPDTIDQATIFTEYSSLQVFKVKDKE